MKKKEVVNHDLVDLPLRSAKFTWSNLEETPVVS